MKLVTQDYGCGISSSILDYAIEDVVVVSENRYEHVFDVEDDLLFIGHDFLFFLWDSDEKISRWMSRKEKWEHWVWCFERVDAIVPVWLQKSHLSLSIANRFCTRILACDEDDCDKYGFDWLPQWASRKFYDSASQIPTTNQVLFSGQTDKPEYAHRTELIRACQTDSSISDQLSITNRLRTFDWEDYVRNLLEHTRILNPVGTLKSLNTRAYESIYSGRLLLQQTIGDYTRHQDMLAGLDNVLFFNTFEQLREKIIQSREYEVTPGNFEEHSLHTRMKSIGVDLK